MLVAAASTLFPEAAALPIASRKQASKNWWEVELTYEQLVDASSELTAEEVSELSGLEVTTFAAARGVLDDGRSVRRIGAGEGNRSVSVLQLLSAEDDTVLDSRVMRWEDSADGQYLELREVGLSAESLSSVDSIGGGGTDLVSAALVCPPPTRPQGVCRKVGKGFFECCAPCAFAGKSAPYCGMVWCSYCLWSHCLKRDVVCVNPLYCESSVLGDRSE